MKKENLSRVFLRIIGIVMSIVVCVTLAACSGKSTASETSVSTDEEYEGIDATVGDATVTKSNNASSKQDGNASKTTSAEKNGNDKNKTDTSINTNTNTDTNSNASATVKPTLRCDFEFEAPANNFSNAKTERPQELKDAVGKDGTGSISNAVYYKNEKRYTGGNYHYGSSWAVISSDANPKQADTYYDWAGNNEYMKLTYCYQPIDLSGIERSVTTADNYKNIVSNVNSKYMKDYGNNPGFTIPSRSDTYKNTSTLKPFYGGDGVTYRITVDVALVNDDGKKVELYARQISSNLTEALAKTQGKVMPANSPDDILICSTAATGDKKLEVQSKTNYTFKKYEFYYTAATGKTIYLYMCTNDGVSIDATAGYDHFACAYVDNIECYKCEDNVESVNLSNNNAHFDSTLILAPVDIKKEPADYKPQNVFKY